MSTTAAVYLRVSTEEQRERQSIETQREFALRWCDSNGVSVAGVYADEGVSGTVPVGDRPEGARMLRDARDGRFQTVLVYRLDRFSRSTQLTLNAVAELKEVGVEIQSLTEPFETSTSHGRFLLTVLSGVAGLERDTILERSRDGTNRLARAGVWLGGVTPFGYWVEGKKKDARLRVSEEPIPGLAVSEADVVRMIYRMSADEGKSCQVIADHLNAIGVPPVYVRDGKKFGAGKRLRATSGIWRPGRVRNLICNTTYKGLHRFGKRSKKQREVIEREVPAIVAPEVWDRAQATLRRNMLASSRNARRKYLLRGLVKCGICGLTYIGTAYPARKGPPKVYYVCNGKQQARGIFGRNGFKCPSKSIQGTIEDIVWQDIEGFLRNPGPILHKLGQRLEELEGATEDRSGELEKLKSTLAAKETEKHAILGLFRRGQIDEPTLTRQLEEIAGERDYLQGAIAGIEAEMQRSTESAGLLSTAEELLRALNARLDEPLTWELKRQIVEALVEIVRVDTVATDNGKEVTVVYRFSDPASPVQMGASRGVYPIRTARQAPSSEPSDAASPARTKGPTAA